MDELDTVTTADSGTSRSLTYIWARRIAICLLGGTVLLAGVAMTVLPGPAIIVIPAGLAILGLEFAWARRWLRAVRAKAEAVMAVARRNSRR